MTPRSIYLRAALIGTALALLLAITPERGDFPSAIDIHALEQARNSGADLTEWQLLARFVSADPDNAAIWERMGILDHRNGLCEQAVFEFGQARQHGDLSPSNSIPYGECLVETGDFQKAIDLLSPLSGDPESPSGLELLLAQTYLRLDDVDNARQVIREWATQDGSNSESLYYLGLFQALTNPADALSTLQKSAEQSAEYENAYRQIQTAINKGQLQDNIAYQALELGRAYGDLGEWLLARTAFQSAVAADPQYAEAYAWLGEARQQLGEDGSAELQKALALNPESVLAQAMNALALQRQGNAQGALVFLEKIALQEPDNPEWLIAIGQSHAILGDLEAAFSDFQRATNLQPENVSTWQALADFCLAYQYAVDSTGIAAANKAVVLAPEDPYSLDLAGQAALVTGKLSEAEGYFSKAIEMEPRYAPAHVHLALVFFQYEDYLSAVSELDKAAALGSLEAENMLEQLKSK